MRIPLAVQVIPAVVMLRLGPWVRVSFRSKAFSLLRTCLCAVSQGSLVLGREVG